MPMTWNILGSATQSWSEYYSNHRAVSVLIRFLHLAALVSGAGPALAADQRILMATKKGDRDREEVIVALRPLHARIVVCLIMAAATGILMTAADLATFLSSWLYWTKMSLVAVLVGNGALIIWAERRAISLGVAAGWRRLAIASGLSALLWLTILYLGVWLTVAA